MDVEEQFKEQRIVVLLHVQVKFVEMMDAEEVVELALNYNVLQHLAHNQYVIQQDNAKLHYLQSVQLMLSAALMGFV